MGVGAGLYMYDVVVKKFTFAISSPDEFLSTSMLREIMWCVYYIWCYTCARLVYFDNRPAKWTWLPMKTYCIGTS